MLGDEPKKSGWLLVGDVKHPVVGRDQAQLFPCDVLNVGGVIAVFDGVGQLGIGLRLVVDLLGQSSDRGSSREDQPVWIGT